MFEQIKEDLPNFPDEVIVDWLLPFAMTDGWPPRRMSRWENLLPHDLVDLSVLQKVVWVKESADVTELQMDSTARGAVSGLCAAYIYNQQGIFNAALGDDGRKRFVRALQYIVQYGVFPRPIVLFAVGDAYTIVDGSHRATAYLYWRKMYDHFQATSDEDRKKLIAMSGGALSYGTIAPAIMQDVWVGRMSS